MLVEVDDQLNSRSHDTTTLLVLDLLTGHPFVPFARYIRSTFKSVKFSKLYALKLIPPP